jgi:hypothetical protein
MRLIHFRRFDQRALEIKAAIERGELSASGRSLGIGAQPVGLSASSSAHALPLSPFRRPAQLSLL